MKLIKDKEFGGERPLFASHDLKLENVTIHTGESALKECSNIEAENCRFEGKYPFWHNNGFIVRNCLFTDGARAALWYSNNLNMTDSVIEAQKMFRDMDTLRLTNIKIPNAAETLWHCKNITINNVEVDNGDYIFMHCENIKIDNLHLNGNYSFQYSKNIVIHNSILNTKDAFWNTEDVTVYDSEINGEYLGWHSNKLRLINCHISGTQPLCYAHDLIMENCTMAEDANLAFEYSSLNIDVKGHITSIKNPITGSIHADSIGEIIIDENIKLPANCRFEEGKSVQ